MITPYYNKDGNREIKSYIIQKNPEEVNLGIFSGAYETRTRDLLRDRQAF